LLLVNWTKFLNYSYIVFCGRVQVTNHTAAPPLFETLYGKSQLWKTVKDHGKYRLAKASFCGIKTHKHYV